MRVLYVYHGTAGLAGAYIQGIRNATRKICDVEFLYSVNHYFAFPGSVGDPTLHREFYRYSENTDRNRFALARRGGPIRLGLRYAELALGYARTLSLVRSQDVDIVNLSLVDDEVPTLLFAAQVRALGRKLFVTAHDFAFAGARSNPKRKRRILELANRIVVHNEHARKQLIVSLGVRASKVAVHPFPWAELTQVLDPRRLDASRLRLRALKSERATFFVLPGVLRKDKGVATLLEAWRLADFAPGEAQLLLAGRTVPGVDVPRLVRGLADVRVIGRYLTNEELWAAIEMADVVTLPYEAESYAHSSLSLVAVLARRPTLTSNIPLFSEFGSRWSFPSGDPVALAAVLRRLVAVPAESRAADTESARLRLLRSWELLPNALRAVYRP